MLFVDSYIHHNNIKHSYSVKTIAYILTLRSLTLCAIRFAQRVKNFLVPAHIFYGPEPKNSSYLYDNVFLGCGALKAAFSKKIYIFLGFNKSTVGVHIKGQKKKL